MEDNLAEAPPDDLRLSACRRVEDTRARDERQVREGLRKVADLPMQPRLVFMPWREVNGTALRPDGGR
jgi:hypothetical protein